MTNSNATNPFNISGKRVLITGASGGIGAAIAERFISSGAMCVLSGSSEAKLALLQEKLSKNKINPEQKVLVKQCNLSEVKSCENLVSETVELLGGIDVLICNAGIARDGMFVRMPEADWNDVIQINLTANFILSKAAVKYMMKQRSGRIVYISSVVGLMGNAGQVNYAASKAGLIGMASSIAKEYAVRGINVNTIAPGFIATEMTHGLDSKAIETAIPLGKFGLPEDIANCALFLSSPASSYITGQVVSVNGGIYI